LSEDTLPMDLSGAALAPRARLRLAKRWIEMQEVRAVLESPEAAITASPCRVIAQGPIRSARYLLRVMVDVDRSPCEIVTA
jgi:hypothetical protein